MEPTPPFDPDPPEPRFKPRPAPPSTLAWALWLIAGLLFVVLVLRVVVIAVRTL